MSAPSLPTSEHPPLKKARIESDQLIPDDNNAHLGKGKHFYFQFKNPLLPLVIDFGCGYGVSLLGLCSDNQSRCNSDPEKTKRFNFVGCDMSPTAINYAKAIGQRWNLAGCCNFVVSEGLSFLKLVMASYPGPIAWVLMQFPTPYTLRSESSQSIADPESNLGKRLVK